jgi:uncharacterized protein (TIGR00251 family)
VSERPPWVADGPDGPELAVHVRPGAARTALAGLHDDAVCVRLRARPVEGAANRELLEVVADALGVRRSQLTLRRGARGRDKRIAVAGLAVEELVRRLAPRLL